MRTAFSERFFAYSETTPILRVFETANNTSYRNYTDFSDTIYYLDMNDEGNILIAVSANNFVYIY